MVEVRLTRDAQTFYEAADKVLAKQLNRCFDQLQQNPYAHPNIRRLKGPLAGQWRYRVGDWRVIAGFGLPSWLTLASAPWSLAG